MPSYIAINVAEQINRLVLMENLAFNEPVFSTLISLRHAFPAKDLAIRFNILSGTVSQILKALLDFYIST